MLPLHLQDGPHAHGFDGYYEGYYDEGYYEDYDGYYEGYDPQGYDGSYGPHDGGFGPSESGGFGERTMGFGGSAFGLLGHGCNNASELSVPAELSELRPTAEAFNGAARPRNSISPGAVSAHGAGAGAGAGSPHGPQGANVGGVDGWSASAAGCHNAGAIGGGRPAGSGGNPGSWERDFLGNLF